VDGFFSAARVLETSCTFILFSFIFIIESYYCDKTKDVLDREHSRVV